MQKFLNENLILIPYALISILLVGCFEIEPEFDLAKNPSISKPKLENTLTIVNMTEDTPQIIDLLYTTDGTSEPTQCQIQNLNNLSIQVSCSCSNGSCAVGVLPCADCEDSNSSFSFEYSLSNSEDASSTTVVIVNVAGVNDGPVAANPESFNGPEDNTLVFSITPATDPDSSPLTYTIETFPSTGVLSNCMGLGGTSVDDLTCDYTTPANYYGTEIFEYSVSDGSQTTSPVTVTLTIDSVNDIPTTVVGESFSGTEDVAINFDISPGSDIEGSVLTYAVTSLPTKGTLINCMDMSGTTGPDDLSCDYQPFSNANGMDSFKYMVFDGVNYSAETTVTIYLTPVNDAPVASLLTPTHFVKKNLFVYFDLPYIPDVDSDPLSFIPTATQTLSYGTLSDCMGLNSSLPTDYTCKYTPNANVTGVTDTFTFKVNDGTLDSSNETTVSFYINSPPVLGVDQTFTGAVEDTPYAFTLNAPTDENGDPIVIYDLSISPSGAGAVSGCMDFTNSTACTFNPVLNFEGTVTIAYKARDDHLHYSNSGYVQITFQPVNDSPVIKNAVGNYLVPSAPSTLVLTDFSDVDSALNFTTNVSGLDGSLSSCSLSGNNYVCIFTPTVAFVGATSFSYTANDGEYVVGPVTVNLTVGICDLSINRNLSIENISVCENQDWNISAGATISLELDQIVDINSLTVQSGGVLTHKGCDLTQCYKVDLNVADSVTISSGGSIDASGKGYLGGLVGINNSTSGRTLNPSIGDQKAGSEYDYSGGSYGGYGGKASVSYSVNEPYGSITAPSHHGSGGGGFNASNVGGNGGGVIRLNIANALQLDGFIMANGAMGNPCGSYCGGGSGGSIWINTNAINSSGTGVLQVNGGNTNTVMSGNGAGGGGRLALYFDSNSGFNLDSTGLQAFGGSGNGVNYGGAGSVFYKDSTMHADGHLIFDNNGNAVAADTLRTKILDKGANLFLDFLTLSNAAMVIQETNAFNIVVSDELKIGTGSSLWIPDDGDGDPATHGPWLSYGTSPTINLGVNLMEY